MNYLTTAQAAQRLELCPQRVRVLLKAGRLPGAAKLGENWMIPEKALAAVAERKTGRPKAKSGEDGETRER